MRSCAASAERMTLIAINADLATNCGAGMVDLACCSFSGEVYEMASSVPGSLLVTRYAGAHFPLDTFLLRGANCLLARTRMPHACARFASGVRSAAGRRHITITRRRSE